MPHPPIPLLQHTRPHTRTPPTHSLTRVVLGADALRGAEVAVSPLVIAGWCGAITTALQLLPVGRCVGRMRRV